MSLTPEIIQAAYRESNLVGLGKEPSAEQSVEGLSLLNRLISGVYGYEVGEPLYDWPIGNDGLVAASSWSEEQWNKLLPNVRMVAGSISPQTVYLPPEPEDGARVALIDPAGRLAAAPITIEGNGRNIQGAPSIVVSVDNTESIWFYRGDQGQWVLLSQLTNDPAEEFPFPMEFDPYFITRLAMRINPRYGRSLSEESATELTLTLRKLRARYRQTQNIPAPLAVLRLSRNFEGASAQGRIVRGRMGWMT